MLHLILRFLLRALLRYGRGARTVTRRSLRRCAVRGRGKMGLIDERFCYFILREVMHILKIMMVWRWRSHW